MARVLWKWGLAPTGRSSQSPRWTSFLRAHTSLRSVILYYVENYRPSGASVAHLRTQNCSFLAVLRPKTSGRKLPSVGCRAPRTHFKSSVHFFVPQKCPSSLKWVLVVLFCGLKEKSFIKKQVAGHFIWKLKSQIEICLKNIVFVKNKGPSLQFALNFHFCLFLVVFG